VIIVVFALFENSESKKQIQNDQCNWNDSQNYAASSPARIAEIGDAFRARCSAVAITPKDPGARILRIVVTAAESWLIRVWHQYHLTGDWVELVVLLLSVVRVRLMLYLHLLLGVLDPGLHGWIVHLDGRRSFVGAEVRLLSMIYLLYRLGIRRIGVATIVRN